MRPATKTLLIAATKTDPNRNEPRPEMRYMGGYAEHRPEMHSGGYADHQQEMTYGGYEEIENRRGRQPRDDRGRYMPKNEMRMGEPMDYSYPEDNYAALPHMPSRTEPPRYEEPRRAMNRIGFNADPEVRTDYAARTEYPRMNEMEHRKSEARMGHGKSNGDYKLTREDADEWMRDLENEDGSRGAHWTFDQVRQVMGQKNVSADPVTFYAVLNMIYSDYGKVFRKYGMADKLDFYVDMAKAFIEDKDAVPDKAAAYYEHIVKR